MRSWGMPRWRWKRCLVSRKISISMLRCRLVFCVDDLRCVLITRRLKAFAFFRKSVEDVEFASAFVAPDEPISFFHTLCSSVSGKASAPLLLLGSFALQVQC